MELNEGKLRLALLDEEFEASANALIRAGVPVVVLQGKDLGRRLSGTRLQRPMTDVDLLVPADMMSRAIEALSHAGFQKLGPFRRGRARVEMSRKEKGPLVEVHHRLLSSDSDEWVLGIWRRAHRVKIPGIQGAVRVLSHEDQLVYLIRHAAVQNVLESKAWLKDIQTVIEGAEKSEPRGPDWISVAAELRRSRSCAAGLLVLTLLKKEWNTSVPDHALWLLSKGITRNRRKAIEAVAQENTWFAGNSARFREIVRRRLLLRDSWLDGFRHACRACVDEGKRALNLKKWLRKRPKPEAPLSSGE